MSRCRYCNARIIMATNQRGKVVLVDEVPHADGNLVFPNGKGERPLTCRVLTPEEIEEAKGRGKLLYISHFATCPERGKKDGRENQGVGAEDAGPDS